MSPVFTVRETGASLDWDGDTKVCLFKLCQFYVGYPAMLASVVMKRQTLLPSMTCSCHLLTLVYTIMILKHKITIIFFPLGNMIGMVLSRTRLILSSLSCRFPTGSAGRMKLFCIVHISAIHI